jgi:hypothetical protein
MDELDVPAADAFAADFLAAKAPGGLFIAWHGQSSGHIVSALWFRLMYVEYLHFTCRSRHVRLKVGQQVQIAISLRTTYQPVLVRRVFDVIVRLIDARQPYLSRLVISRVPRCISARGHGTDLAKMGRRVQFPYHDRHPASISIRCWMHYANVSGGGAGDPCPRSNEAIGNEL